MNDVPLITVIIPTLDRGHLIDRALTSVRESSYPQVELIVVDQGSRDDTVSMLQQRGIRVHLEPVKGAGKARKTGLEECAGDYVLFLDSDDWLTPDSLSLLLTAIRERDAEMAFGSTQMVDLLTGTKSPAEPRLAPLTSSTLTRIGAFEKYGPFDDDNFSWPRWVSNARRHGLAETSFPDIVAYRGIHEDNVSKQEGATGELFALIRAHRQAPEN